MVEEQSDKLTLVVFFLQIKPEEEQKQKHICRIIENIPECVDLELTNDQPEATHVLVVNTLKTRNSKG